MRRDPTAREPGFQGPDSFTAWGDGLLIGAAAGRGGSRLELDPPLWALALFRVLGGGVLSRLLRGPMDVLLGEEHLVYVLRAPLPVDLDRRVDDW